jgi:glycosyltransferase involved in cell wall biosynthesis
MKILALTHAHLAPDGLSPVSCERADSITGIWAAKLNWDVDVIYTKNTKWRGIWPGGKGLKINIINADAPEGLMMGEPQLFSATLKTQISQKQYSNALSLVSNRIRKRIRSVLSNNNFALPHQLSAGRKWGVYLSSLSLINQNKYDYIFVSAGYGDEYLLQTGLVLSKKLHVPMIVDFRDLWSEHHDPTRFTPAQKKQIHNHEKKLLTTTALISVPQKHMKVLLDKWVPAPVYHLPHSPYIGKDWKDGHVVSNEFRILYAGKLYANGPGITMLLELIRKLSETTLPKPFTCHFFVDDTATLKKLVDKYGIANKIMINEWVSPWELWQNLRSAHLLVIIDSSTEENYPILLTKTFQYAYSGRQLLCLQQHRNDEMKEFLDLHRAGAVFTDTDEAVKWVTQLSAGHTQYEALPPLRDIPTREDVAEQFGKEIESLHAHE